MNVAADPTSTALTPFRPGGSGGESVSLLAVSRDGQLVASPSPDRTTADGYLRLTARILLEAEKHGFRTIGVISALDGEGRTTAAINLAVCLGRARGRAGRVLLVDGDTRRRALTRMFCADRGEARGGAPGAPSTPTAGSAEGAVTHPMLVATGFDGVDVMTAPVADGLTIAAPGAWVAMFQELAAQYSLIVIDCPAVIEDPAGLVLRECVEGIVLVIRAGRTPRRLVERAVGKVGGRVIGVVMNGMAGATGDRTDLWR